MKVFISWSGSRSRAVAEHLHDWIKCVLQATYPWMSSRDIDRGSLWFTEISDQLKDTSVGIICLTQENKDKPWILFEAGALAKGLSSSRVCTFLIDLKPSDLDDPLAQFNHTIPDRDGMRSLVGTLNSALGPLALPVTILEQVFSTYWGQFENKFKSVLKEAPQQEKTPPKSDKELLAEILDNTRYLQHRVRRLEYNLERPNSDSPKDRDYRRSTLMKVVSELMKEGHSPTTVIELLSERYSTERIVECIKNLLGVEEGIIKDMKP